MFFIKLFTLPIRFYRYFISPLTPPTCRFEPTCSQYAINSIEENGVIRGSIMAVKRISKCHPWYKGDWIHNYSFIYIKNIDLFNIYKYRYI